MMYLETNKKIKSYKMRHIFLIFLVIETIMCFSLLYFFNNILNDSSNVEDNNTTLVIPNHATNVSFSFDHKYLHYIQDGKLVIWDIKKNCLFKKVEEKHPIIYSYFLDDRNIITYFVQWNNPNGNNKEYISIKTFNLESKKVSDYGYLTINNFQKIDQVVYSSLTNVIYINVSVKDGSQNIIYRIDIMKNRNVYASGKSIKNIVLLKDVDKLLYEDNNGNIYMNNKLLNIENYKKFQLLGSDADDNIYLLPYDENKILKVKNQKIVDTIVLDDSCYKTVINNKSGVFLVYDHYVFDIVNNPDNKLQFDEGSKLLDLFDHTIYTLNNKNEINIGQNMF